MSIKKITHHIAIAALFLIPLFALFPTPNTPFNIADSFFFPFITGKAFYFRTLVEIAFASWIILAFLDPRYRPKISVITIGVTLFAMVALLADLLGVNPIRSLWSNFERMEGWMVIVHLWAFYMTASNMFSSTLLDSARDSARNKSLGTGGSRMWRYWLNFSIFVALIVSIYGLAQLFGWTATHQGATRIDASLGNASYMAVYMFFHAFAAAYLFFTRSRKNGGTLFGQWVYAISALLFGFLIFETQTRGTTLGLIGGVMLALTLYAIFGKGESKKKRYISAGIVIAIILIGAIFWMNRKAEFIQRSPILGRLATISWSDASNQARQYIWPAALNGAMERPILGWGQENFNYIFNANYNPKMWSQEQWFDRAHSVFLDWLVASGFLGLIAYLALYGLFLVVLWKSSLGITEKSVLTGLLAGYFVHNLFVFDNLASYIMFFAFLGLVNSLRENKPMRIMGQNPVRVDAVEYIVAPIAIIILVGVVYFFNVRPMQANTKLISGLMACGGSNPDITLFKKALSVNTYVANQEIREQLMNCSGRVIASQQVAMPTKEAFFAEVMSDLNTQITLTPKDARIYVLFGTFLNSLGQYTQSKPILEKAYELTPRKQTVAFELGTAYLNTGETEKALALLKEAYDFAPEYFQAKNAYVIAMVIAGRETEARKIFDNDKNIFETAQMAQVYMSLKQYSKGIVIYKKLVESNPTDVNAKVQLAQAQYVAGLKDEAIETMRSIIKTNPELKDQIEASIKQIK